MPENKTVYSVVGDFGNPSGTGLSRITLEDVKNDTDMTAELTKTTGVTLHAALVTAQLTATVLGDAALTSKLPSFVAKPANSVNVDRILVADWRTKNDSTIRRISIPGVPTTSTSLELVDNGERLNEAGKTALGTALSTFYGVSGDAAILVLRGKVLQKS